MTFPKSYEYKFLALSNKHHLIDFVGKVWLSISSMGVTWKEKIEVYDEEIRGIKERYKEGKRRRETKIKKVHR